LSILSHDLIRSIPLYTLYGQLLEEYHHDGRGFDLIANLYHQRMEPLSQSQSTVAPAPASSASSASMNPAKVIDLELISKTVETERRRRNHDDALAILSDSFNNADKQRPRSDDTFLTNFFIDATGVCTHAMRFR
jgi:hypothetical protein